MELVEDIELFCVVQDFCLVTVYHEVIYLMYFDILCQCLIGMLMCYHPPWTYDFLGTFSIENLYLSY